MMDLQDRFNKAKALGPDFGDGWLSRNATDLVRIALFAGFDRKELLRRLCFDVNPGRVTNAASVERILAEMSESC